MAYANELVTANLESQTTDGILHKVSADLAAKGILESQVAAKLQEYWLIALQQLQAEK
jgi:hypothetical protein